MSLDLCTNFRTNFEHYDDATFAIEKVCCMINKDHYLTKDSHIVLQLLHYFGTLIWYKNSFRKKCYSIGTYTLVFKDSHIVLHTLIWYKNSFKKFLQ